jgi:hypothetical protein
MGVVYKAEDTRRLARHPRLRCELTPRDFKSGIVMRKFAIAARETVWRTKASFVELPSDAAF